MAIIPKNELKFLVFGPYNAGKTSLVKAVCKNAINTDRLGTTVGLDFGVIECADYVVYLFGLPGHDRFKFMKNVLSQNINGLILVVDSAFPEFFQPAIKLAVELGYPDIPMVVAANKQDTVGALPPELVRVEMEELGLLKDTPIIGTVAIKSVNVLLCIKKLISKNVFLKYETLTI